MEDKSKEIIEKLRKVCLSIDAHSYLDLKAYIDEGIALLQDNHLRPLHDKEEYLSDRQIVYLTFYITTMTNGLMCLYNFVRF